MTSQSSSSSGSSSPANDVLAEVQITRPSPIKFGAGGTLITDLVLTKHDCSLSIQQLKITFRLQRPGQFFLLSVGSIEAYIIDRTVDGGRGSPAYIHA